MRLDVQSGGVRVPLIAVLNVIAAFGLVSLIALVSVVDHLGQKIEDLEGRISLTEGKAILTPGRSCILDEQTLSDESLAFQMTRACLRAYDEKSAITQEQ